MCLEQEPRNLALEWSLQADVSRIYQVEETMMCLEPWKEQTCLSPKWLRMKGVDSNANREIHTKQGALSSI